MITQRNTNSKWDSWALQFLKTHWLKEVSALIYPNFSALVNQWLLLNTNFHLWFSKCYLSQGYSSVRGKQILGYIFIRPIKNLHQSKIVNNEKKGCTEENKKGKEMGEDDWLIQQTWDLQFATNLNVEDELQFSRFHSHR